MLSIHSHRDDDADELVVVVDAGDTRLLSMRLPVSATFEDFAAEVQGAVVGRELVRGFAGRNAEDPEVAQ